MSQIIVSICHGGFHVPLTVLTIVKQSLSMENLFKILEMAVFRPIRIARPKPLFLQPCDGRQAVLMDYQRTTHLIPLIIIPTNEGSIIEVDPSTFTLYHPFLGFYQFSEHDLRCLIFCRASLPSFISLSDILFFYPRLFFVVLQIEIFPPLQEVCGFERGFDFCMSKLPIT